jgi:hypothetical protein
MSIILDDSNEKIIEKGLSANKINLRIDGLGT